MNPIDITSTIEREAAPERLSCLPSEEEIAAASPDQRAILYAESLARAKELGETVDPARVAAAVGLFSELAARHAPRLLAKAPAIAAEVKAGRRGLPKAGNAWHFLCERGAKEAAAAAAAATETETSPIGDAKGVKAESPTGDAVEVVEEKVESPIGDSDEYGRFEELKRIVHSKLDAFLEVGMALAEIQAKRLYRLAGFERFEDFVRKEFNLSKPYSYRLIDAVGSVEDLAGLAPDVPLPTNSEQVRPLAGLPPEEKREIWTEAVASAPPGQAPTGFLVKQVRDARGGKAKPSGKPKSKPSGKPKVVSNGPSQEEQPPTPEIAAEAFEAMFDGWNSKYLEPLLDSGELTDEAAAELEEISEEIDAFVLRIAERLRALAS